VLEAYRRWAHLYSKDLQGELRSDKSFVYAPSPNLSLEALLKLGFPVGMKFSQDGTRVLGAPIGNDTFKAQFASDKVDAILKDLDVLALMPSFQAQHLIATKSIAHRINHLLRNIPGGEIDLFGDLAFRYDNALLLVPNRICHQISFEALPRLLCSLPQAHGGLGYRTWASTCDSAFLAAYTHTSHTFPLLFPQYKNQFPQAQSITAATSPVPRQAYFASRALARLRSVSLTAAETIIAPPPSLRELQHNITSNTDSARALQATALCHVIDAPDHPRHAAMYYSNCGDPHTFSSIPIDADTTFTNPDFATIMARRLLIQITPNTREKRRCSCCTITSDTRLEVKKKPTSYPALDLYGDHQVLCMTKMKGLRASRWHDPVVRMIHRISKAANIPSSYEPSSYMILSNQRPDVVVHSDPLNGRAIVVDCRTNDPTLAGDCVKCAQTPGAANDEGTRQKNSKWLPVTTAQRDTFLPFCIEVGGRISTSSLDFLRNLSFATSNTSSDRAAFLIWALQRIHCTSQRGVAQMIQACPSIRADSHELPFGGLVPLGLPPPPPAFRRPVPLRPPFQPPVWPPAAALALPDPQVLLPLPPPLPLSPVHHFPISTSHTYPPPVDPIPDQPLIDPPWSVGPSPTQVVVTNSALTDMPYEPTPALPTRASSQFDGTQENQDQLYYPGPPLGLPPEQGGAVYLHVLP